MWKLVVIGGVILAVLMALTSQSSAQTTFTGFCVKIKKGTVRIVTDSSKCTTSETFISWAAGPQGPQGSQGPQGPVGPQGPAGSAVQIFATHSGLVVIRGGEVEADLLSLSFSLDNPAIVLFEASGWVGGGGTGALWLEVDDGADGADIEHDKDQSFREFIVTGNDFGWAVSFHTVVTKTLQSGPHTVYLKGRGSVSLNYQSLIATAYPQTSF